MVKFDHVGLLDHIIKDRYEHFKSILKISDHDDQILYFVSPAEVLVQVSDVSGVRFYYSVADSVG